MIANLLLALPLLAPAGLQVSPTDESPIAEALAQADAALDRIVSIAPGKRTFANTPAAIDGVTGELFRSARRVSFLKDVSTDTEERDRGRRADSDLDGWFSRFHQREDVYRSLQAFAQEATGLEPLQQRLVDELLLTFERGGLQLDESGRARLLELDRRLSELENEYTRNIAEDRSLVPLTREELVGVPDSFLDSLPTAGDLLLCRTTGAVVSRVITLCENGATRLKVVIAYGRRAGQRNIDVLESLLKVRAEKANLLGYPSIAAYNVETRMAGTPERVFAFYEELVPKLRAKALADFEEYQAAKREHIGDPQARLEGWDLNYYARYLRSSRYAVDSEVLREYFPLEAVTEGLFSITQSLYGLSYRDITGRAAEVGLPIWHEEVRLFEVRDSASEEVLGAFYIDLHPRPGKTTRATHFPLQRRRVLPDGSVQPPLVALACNFTRPTGDDPALLSHREVETYFHEFGHCLHSLLSTAPYATFSPDQVARDFIEAPSQMFENWVWDPEVLGTFARHHRTGEPIPPELLQGMVAARSLGSGLDAQGQVFLGLMDMRFHTAPGGEIDTTKARTDIYRRTRLIDPLDCTHSHSAFGHFVGYDAGYYGYLWSKVYAADMFARFQELGLLDPEAGRLYRETVLAPGSSAEELDLVRNFLGREPQPDAFLRQLGLGD